MYLFFCITHILVKSAFLFSINAFVPSFGACVLNNEEKASRSNKVPYLKPSSSPYKIVFLATIKV
jgi:hypothetical protein